MMFLCVFLLLLVTGPGSAQAQCWTSSDCTGDTVPANDARDCCAGTNDGQSYGVGPGNCEIEQCIVHGFLNANYNVVEDERLDTTFRLNVKGMTNFPSLNIEGTITAMAGPTTSQADFESLMPIQFQNEAEIRIFTSNDEIALEYDDRVILSFTPDNSALIPGLEAQGEYVRDSATVQIIDNDRLEIVFEESDYSIEEGGTLSTDIRFQFRNNQNPFSVRLCPVNISTVEALGLGFFINSEDIDNISRATSGADFSEQCTDIIVPAAETAGSQTYTIEKFFTVDDDDLNEVEQSFALTAEIGDDVPSNCFVEMEGFGRDCSCFQRQDGDTDCFGDGRSGATEIRITDNDLMVIGFTERRRTVSEGQELGVDEFPLEIDVSTLRVSEREHRMLYRVLSSGTATVVSFAYFDNLDFDARFGFVQADPIEQEDQLLPGRDFIDPLQTAIRNDFVPENEECYSIRLSPIDIPGLRELFMCDFVDTSSTPPVSFFCEHTICIEDNDDPFEVGFVETIYTVSESVGSVEVCVSLTQPTFDILDQFVVVEVTDFPSSVYLPAGATLATPDVPNFLGLYPMAPMTDFSQQTVRVNAIDDETITELTRIVCYDQPIYEDMRLEGDEWLGLTLGVDRSSVLTTVRPLYDQAVILIQDNDTPQCWTSSGCTGDTVPADDARDCCVGTNDGQSYGVGPGNCTVEQCIVHGFLNATYFVVEDERLNTTFRLNVKGMTNFPLTIEGTITAMAGPTTSQSDFESLMPISFVNEAEIRLFTSNDETTLEYDDSVILTFTPSNPAFITGLEAQGEYVRDTATVQITDDDRLEINFDESDYSIEEGGTLSTYIRFQFRNNQNNFSVRLCPVNISVVEEMGLGEFIDSVDIDIISRATAGADFSEQCTDIIVPAAETPGTQTYIIQKFFTVVDDNINEVEQSFALIAELGDDVPSNCFVVMEGFGRDCSCFQKQVGDLKCFGDGRSGATEIRITDNDMMVIGFTERRRTVSEGQVPGVDEFQLEIDVAALRVSEWERRMLYRVLSSGTASVVSFEFRDNLDYDARFGVVQAYYIGQEDQLLPGRNSTGPLQTAIRNDFIPEDEECYSIQISPIDIPGLKEVFSCDFVDTSSTPPMTFFCEHTICIEDDDDPYVVGFVKTIYTVPESVGSVEVCVNLTKPQIDILAEFVVVEVYDFPSSVLIPADVTLATPDVPNFLGLYPMAPMTDYAQQIVGVNAIDDETITELMRIVCYDQPIYDDTLVEGDEWLGLTLDVDRRSSVLTTVRPMYDQAAILIQDNDMAVVGLEQTFFSVSEDVGVVELCANVSFPVIDCPIKFPFEVQLSTCDGTAMAPGDYIEFNVTMMFEPCKIRRCVDVTIVNDFIDEPDENFFYKLRRTPDLHPRITLDPVDGEIVIVDDDVPILVGYDPTAYITSESSGFVVLNISVFSHPVTGTPRPFTLSVSTQDGTAVSPDDYVGVSGEIIQFNTGDTNHILIIAINDDQLCESVEYFFFNTTLVSGVPPIEVLGYGRVGIYDSREPECGNLSLGFPTTYTISEGSSLDLLLFGIIGTAVSAVNFDLIPLTYNQFESVTGQQASSVFPTLPPPASEGDISLSGTYNTSFGPTEFLLAADFIYDVSSGVVDDDELEGDEGFILYFDFSDPRNSPFDLARLQAGNRSILVTIQDDDESRLTCTASGLSEVTIDCEGIDDPSLLQCSFDSGPLYPCSVPMVLTIDVSPAGTHSVSIVASNVGNDTVTYIITDTEPEVEPVVPKLRVDLVNGSPRLTAGGTAVEAEFEVSRPVAGVRCYLRSQSARDYKDCSSGVVLFEGLKPGRYALKVHAYNRGGDVATAKSGFIVN